MNTFSAKLTEAKVKAIRGQYAAGTTQDSLASANGVTRTLISHIVHRRAWAHV